MKILTTLLTVLAVIVITTAAFTFQKDDTVRHVVVFKYTPDATDAQIQKITDAFRDLKDQIPGITGFEYGTNNSPEGLNQDFTHVYLLTFENEAARDAYLPHPKHAAFGEILRGSGIFDGAFVIDYVAMD